MAPLTATYRLGLGPLVVPASVLGGTPVSVMNVALTSKPVYRFLTGKVEVLLWVEFIYISARSLFLLLPSFAFVVVGLVRRFKLSVVPC